MKDGKTVETFEPEVKIDKICSEATPETIESNALKAW